MKFNEKSSGVCSDMTNQTHVMIPIPFFKYFLMWIIFKIFIELVTILFLFYVLFFGPQGM